MKNVLYLLVGSLLVLSSHTNAQKSFCQGWEEGFKRGMQYKNRNAFVTPICPVVIRGKETYENGFERGFEKATGKKTTVIFNAREGKNSFCDGWKAGYTNTMNKTRRVGFVVPICPIARINADSYESGYIRGSLKAKERLNKNETSSFTQVNTEGTFCEGWEKGYRIGLEIWATKNNEAVPLKITPICPIAKINQDEYVHGFEQGKQRALKDMNE